MREALKEAVEKAQELGRENATRMGKIMVAAQPETQNEMMMVLGAYMSALDEQLRAQANATEGEGNNEAA